MSRNMPISLKFVFMNKTVYPNADLHVVNLLVHFVRRVPLDALDEVHLLRGLRQKCIPRGIELLTGWFLVQQVDQHARGFHGGFHVESVLKEEKLKYSKYKMIAFIFCGICAFKDIEHFKQFFQRSKITQKPESAQTSILKWGKILRSKVSKKSSFCRIGVGLKLQNCEHGVKYDVICGSKSDTAVTLDDVCGDDRSVVFAEDSVDRGRRCSRK